MSKIFSVHFDNKSGCASDGKPTWLFSLPDKGYVANWSPITFQVMDGINADFLNNEIRCRLCSQRFRDAIVELKGPDDEIQWLPADVIYNGDTYEYFIMHFPNLPDTIDKAKSLYDFRGDVYIPTFQHWMPNGYRIFRHLPNGPMGWFIDMKVKLEFKKRGFTGLAYDPGRVADAP